MNKLKFKEIFDECMKTDKGIGCQVDSETGKVYEYLVDVKPCMVIRDFEIDDSDERESGVWDADKFDKEFIDFDKAWDFYKEHFPTIRVMDNAGRIFFDYFSYKDDVKNQECSTNPPTICPECNATDMLWLQLDDHKCPAKLHYTDGNIANWWSVQRKYKKGRWTEPTQTPLTKRQTFSVCRDLMENNSASFMYDEYRAVHYNSDLKEKFAYSMTKDSDGGISMGKPVKLEWGDEE